MKKNQDCLHIVFNEDVLDNDSSEKFSDRLDITKIEYLQVKNLDQFDRLIGELEDNRLIFVWVHPNNAFKKAKGFNTTAGQDIARALRQRGNIKFNLITRIIDEELLAFAQDLGVQVYKTGDIWKAINGNSPQSASQIRKSITYEIKKGSKSDIDFAIITALYDDECTTFIDNMDKLSDVNGIKNCKRGVHAKLQKHYDYQKEFVIINQDRMGVIDAASFATQLIFKHNPTYLIMGGVCGGRKSKQVELYDVIIPHTIFDYITGKLENDEFISYNHKSKTNDDLIKFLRKQKSNIKAGMLSLSKSSPALQSIVDKVNIHIGDLACGPWVVKTKGFLEHEVAVEEKQHILGVEMESLSILRASENFQEYGKYALVVKSVMDFTDERKTDGKNGIVKSNAAYISYLCIRALMPILLTFQDSKLKT